MAVDYIPRPNTGFYNFQKNVVEKVLASGATWGIPAGEVTAFQTASLIYSQNYQAITNRSNRTKTQVEMHAKSRKRFEKQLRQFVNQWLASNSSIPVKDKIGMKLSLRERKKHTRPQLTTFPVVMVVARPGARVLVMCREEEDRIRVGIPKHADGVELAYCIGAEPADYQQATVRVVSKAARHELRLDITDAGKMIYVFARWVNLRNHAKSGPWSSVGYTMVTI